MTAIRHAILFARRRIVLQDGLTLLGKPLLAAGVVDLTALLLERLCDGRWPWWWLLLPAGLALLGAGGRAWWRRPGELAAAAAIDQRLHLKDSLATALYARALPNDPFAQRVRRDAEDTAARLPLRRAFALRYGRVWAWIPVVAVTVALLGWLLPHDLLGLGTRRQQAAQKQQRERQTQAAARQELVQAVAALQKAREQPGVSDPDPDNAAALGQLAELTKHDLSNPKVQRDTVVKLSSVQEKLAQAAARKKQQVQTLQNALSRLDAGLPGPADRFADALRRGDFAAAAKELATLAQQAQSLSAADQRALREQLQNLAQQLQDAAQQQAQEQQSPQSTQPQSRQSQSQCQNNTNNLSQSLGKMSQGLGPQGNAAQITSGAQQGSQSLAQLARMQQQLQQMRTAQSQMQQAMQSLTGSAPTNRPNWNSLQQSARRTDQNRSGGHAGNQEGGNPLGQERQMQNYQTEAHGDIGQGEGRVIASWLSAGPNAAGQPTAEFDKAVTQARDEAEKAITEDRVPQRYHQAIKNYFNQLPQNPGEVTKPSAPPAPK